MSNAGSTDGGGRKRRGDAELVLALACGATPDNAAAKAGVSRRTVFRRLAEPGFRAQVAEMRSEMARRASGMLAAAGLASVKTLATLQESATSESVRLGAARATLALGCQLRESLGWAERLAAIEQRLNALLGDTNAFTAPADGA